jgi:hypothetical protein
MIAPSHITAKLWKTWIEANPELAMASTERFCRQAEDLGMKKKMHETDGYVYLVADHTDAGLDFYYA